jgi:hypothetical protein
MGTVRGDILNVFPWRIEVELRNGIDLGFGKVIEAVLYAYKSLEREV